eukprot:1108167-Prymnesium_polylepis.2
MNTRIGRPIGTGCARLTLSGGSGSMEQHSRAVVAAATAGCASGGSTCARACVRAGGAARGTRDALRSTVAPRLRPRRGARCCKAVASASRPRTPTSVTAQIAARRIPACL